MKLIKFFFLLLPLVIVSQNIDLSKTFKLDNGLTVILDKDTLQTKVFGVIAVNAGSKDEELDATGMAHYLEHMLFKGTKELGTTDWNSEKLHYEKIISLYDKLQTTQNEDEEKEVYKQINEVSQKQSKYVITNEFTKLIQQMGGVGLNATTSFDVTRYFNTFPKNQLERWLDLYAHRFINPVFRLFQTELETVYEEKNRAEDNPMNGFSNALMKATYGDHPYARPIIGKTEHLKKPSMSKMIEFYNKWYVPSNMILVLSGNFDMEQAEKMIKDKFGKWKARNNPVVTNLPVKKFKGKEKVKVKLTPYLRAAMSYNGPKDSFSKEGLSLKIASELLSNTSSTGVLDKLSLDGSVMFAGASYQALKDGSTFSIHYAPVFDRNQRRQMSFSSVEKIINLRLNSLKKGMFTTNDLKQVKANMIRDWSYQLESSQQRAFSMVNYFINGKNPTDIFKLEEMITSVTKQDIIDSVNKYLGNDYLLFYSYKGDADKEKVKKPEIEPIKPNNHQPSIYARKFMDIQPFDIKHDFVNFATDVKRGLLKDKVKLFHVSNKRNDLFSMTLVYHTGLIENPKLGYATSLLNTAGISAQLEPNELKKEFGKLGVDYGFSVSDNYTKVRLSGREESLEKACQLLSKLMIMPQISEKALNRLLGNLYYSRSIEAKKLNSQYAALVEYIKHGKKSSYIDRVTIKEVENIRSSELASEFSKAMAYKLDIHYYGNNPIDSVANKLINNLVFVANMQDAKPFQRNNLVTYDNNKIFFVKNNKVSQSKVFFYVPSNKVSIRKRPLVDAFNQYFSGGFNGLVLKEIREFRSLAYSANATFSKPLLPEWSASLYGSLGTQTDKTNDAIQTFITLLKDMPQKESKMKSIKDYLINSSYLSRPSDRLLSQNILNWELQGYKFDPQRINVPYYKMIKFENILDFYKYNIQGKPYVIGIVGSVSDLDKLKQYGDVTIISSSKLFSKK